MPPIGRFTLGAVNTLEDCQKALREVESWLSLLLPRDVPLTTKVLVRDNQNLVKQYDIVSTGGCTVTVDNVNQQIKISVP